MRRRDFLIQSGLSAGLVGLMPAGSLWGMTSPDYTGPLVVVVQASGGWDVTSFCDPKMNVPNELEINHWANGNETQQVGNIRYAPWASNETFFQKYHDRMLVINGIDAQTNSHDVGMRHNFSGRLSAGYPALQALVARIYAADMSVSWLNNGGYAETAELIRYSRMGGQPELIHELAYPNRIPGENNGASWLLTEDWNAIQSAQRERMNALQNKPGLLPWQKKLRDIHYSARENADSLKAFADLLPNEEVEILDDRVAMKSQSHVALLAFKSGVAMTADLSPAGFPGEGFDSHHEHDGTHEPILGGLTDGVDYLWETAEEMGLADRLTVILSSDFGRTPHYNEGNGKDHWPIGSAIFMQKNAAWGNRVVGLTDEGHNAIKLNPATLQPDENGTFIYPKHVMAAARRLTGIDDHPITQRFPLNNLEEFDFFNPNIQTPQGSGDPRNTIR